MKVLQVGKLYPPHIGGVERHMQDLAFGLKSLGVDVEVLAAQDQMAFGRSEIMDGVLVHRVGTLGVIASTPVAPGFAWQLSRCRADCLHFHFPYPWGEVSAWAIGLRQPYVVTYHMDIWRQRLLLAPIEPILKRFLAGAACIICFSTNLAESSEWLRPHRDKLTIIPPGFDLQRYERTPASQSRAATLRDSLHTELPVAITVGRLVEFKGIRFLVEAMRDVRGLLAIVGDGPERHSLECLARKMQVEDRVRFVGAVSEQDLPAWYQSADLFVSSSHRPAEAFGLAIAEAAASGLPLVSTDLPTGVRFVNLHRETGIVVPPGSPSALAASLNELISSQELRARYGSSARIRAQTHFDRHVMAARTLDIYHQVTNWSAPLCEETLFFRT